MREMRHRDLGATGNHLRGAEVILQAGIGRIHCLRPAEIGCGQIVVRAIQADDASQVQGPEGSGVAGEKRPADTERFVGPPLEVERFRPREGRLRLDAEGVM